MDDMAFGHPTRYLQLKPECAARGTWDSAVEKASLKYDREMHILCWNK